MSRLRVLVPFFALSLLLIFAVPAPAADGPTFPESHKDFLGGASYAALFGFNASSGQPGPHSSDTGTGMPPRVGPNTQVNGPQSFFPNGLIGRSETSIAVARNGEYLVVGWNDADGFCGPPFGAPCTPPPVPGLSGYGWSADGGQTWTDGGAPFLVGGAAVTRGDPSVDVGGRSNDTFYYANLAVDVGGAGPDGMTVHSGSFKRKTFSWNNGVFIAPANGQNDFLDKELLVADKRGGSEDVHVSVTNFIEVLGNPQFGFGQIEVYTSNDGAASFGPATIVQADETSSVPLNQGIVNQGSMPAVGPEGNIYVTWERGFLFPFFGGAQAPQIVVSTSTDGGATWGARTLVSDICSGALFPPAGYNRGSTNDFPRIAVANSGPNRGRVYVAYQDCRIANGGAQAVTGGFGDPDTDIYVAYSDDAGATWTNTLVVGGGDGLIQFWPTISIQPGGNVDVTYYESDEATSPGTSLVDVYWAQSIEGGATWETPVRVSEVTTDWGATFSNIVPNFGDYNTAVSTGDRVYATWADGRNGVPDVFFSKIQTIGKAPH